MPAGGRAARTLKAVANPVNSLKGRLSPVSGEPKSGTPTESAAWYWWDDDPVAGSAAGQRTGSPGTGGTAETKGSVRPLSAPADPWTASRNASGRAHTTVIVVAAIVLILTGSALAFGLYATGIATMVTMALIFGTAAGIEAGWRLYGRRDPEAIQEMGFPPPTARAGPGQFLDHRPGQGRSGGAARDPGDLGPPDPSQRPDHRDTHRRGHGDHPGSRDRPGPAIPTGSRSWSRSTRRR